MIFRARRAPTLNEVLQTMATVEKQNLLCCLTLLATAVAVAGSVHAKRLPRVTG